MKKIIMLLVALMLSFSAMAVETTKTAAPEASKEITKEVAAPVVVMCEKKALKACKHSKHITKIEKKYKCTCPTVKK